MKFPYKLFLGLGLILSNVGLAHILYPSSDSRPFISFGTAWKVFTIILFIGFLVALYKLAKNGWPEKLMEKSKGTATTVLVLKALGIFKGEFAFFGALFGIQHESILFIVFTLINLGIWYVYKKWPRGYWLIIGLVLNLGFLTIPSFTFGIMLPLDSLIKSWIMSGYQIFIFSALTIYIYEFRWGDKANFMKYKERSNPEIPGNFARVSELSFDYLVQGLEHHQIIVQAEVAEELGRRNDPRSIEPLTKSLHHAPALYWMDSTPTRWAWEEFKHKARPAVSNILLYNRPYLKGFPHVYCQACLRHAEKYSAPGNINWVMCPNCNQHEPLQLGVHRVAGVIGTKTSYKNEGGQVFINVWDAETQSVISAEIDDLLITQDAEEFAHDWAASAFVAHFENDKRNENRKIPIKIDPQVSLTQNTRNLLKSIQK